MDQSRRWWRHGAAGIVVLVALVGCQLVRPTITTERVAVATVGTTYDAPLVAEGGKAPFTWSANRLPEGLVLEGSHITGTPTKALTLAIRLKVLDRAGVPDYQTLQIHIQSEAQRTAVSELNRQRTAMKLPAFGSNTEASIKAQAWAKRLAHDDALSSSDLKDRQPLCATATAETVGVGASSAAAIDAWMQSAAARAKIANPKLTRVGLGVQPAHDKVYVVAELIGGC